MAKLHTATFLRSHIKELNPLVELWHGMDGIMARQYPDTAIINDIIRKNELDKYFVQIDLDE